MAEGTKGRLVMEARRLFAEKGYGATSIADILKASGVNAGSLYHFFPTKQDLLLEVLRRYAGGIGPMLLEPAWAGIEDPIERVFALLAAYRRLLEQSDCLYGCPIGSLALELHEPDPPVREMLAANFDAWADAVEACYRAARDRLAKGTDCRALAVFTLTIMEGAVMLARTHRSLAPYDASIAMLRDHLGRLQSEARATRRIKERGRER